MLFYVLGGLAIVAAVGSLLETYQPQIFSGNFKQNMSAITLGLAGIFASLLLLLILIKSRVREGFQATPLLDQLRDLPKLYKLSEICAMYTDIYDKLVLLEKGPPPSSVTDAQARERAEKTFRDLMRSNGVSCKKIQEIESASTLDSMFEAMSDVDPELLVQAYETALASRELTLQQYTKVQQAKAQRVEAFVVCSREQADERRKQRDEKEKEKAIEKCILPEEVSPQEKEAILDTKLKTLISTLEKHRKQYKLNDSIDKLLEDYNYYKNELEKEKQAAQDGSLIKSMKS